VIDPTLVTGVTTGTVLQNGLMSRMKTAALNASSNVMTAPWGGAA